MSDTGVDVATYLPASFLSNLAVRPLRGLPWYKEIEGTLVMADLSGFTALSESLARLGDEGAERLTEVINSFFARMLKRASAYGGDTLTFGGDAILLLFEGDQHADRAVAASLAMLEQTAHSAAVESGGGRIKLGMSAGASSGGFLLAAAGITGQRAQLFVLGREAEVTARTEAGAGTGELFISSATAELLGGRCRIVPVGECWKVEEHRVDCRPARRASEETLGEPLWDQVAAFLPPFAATNRPEGERRYEAAAEHRRVCVVFANILGLNGLIDGEGIDPAMEQLQVYTEALLRLAGKHHGFIVSSDIAIEGTKLILTFGAPVAHEYAAANAARFALELDAELRRSGLDIRHRIGINGGHVFAGEVGPSFRRQYTVMGDEVNLAARLMAAAEPGQILASRSFLEHAGTAFCARELAPIRVKGKTEPVAVCLLEAERRDTLRVSAAEASLVGREEELASILACWQAARAGTGRTVVIEGEPGVGKSRLLQEALESMRDADRITRAACYEHLQGVPFTPWVEVVSSVCGLSNGMSEGERTVAVDGRLRSVAGDIAEFGSLLNPLLGLRLPVSEVVAALDPGTSRERLFAVVTRLIATAGCENGSRGRHGHVVAIEDAHWADESSLALMAHLAGHISREPVLLLVSRRPEGAFVVGGSEAKTIALEELGPAESARLIRAALGVPDLPEEVTETIHAKTRGNPLFLEEVIHSLQKPGLLARILGESSVARAAEMAALEIPDRVQGLLMSRIDQLPTDTRDVLKAASVLGRTVERRVVEGLDDAALRAIALDRALTELVRSGLILPEPDVPQHSYVFRHALVQEVAYESLPYARRRELHGLVAHYLEATLSPPDHGLLVHHYQGAGDRPKTLVHAAKAAEAATAVYAFAEAVDYLDLARAQVQARTAGAACLRSRLDELAGDSLESIARHDGAVTRYIEARRRVCRIGRGLPLTDVPADSLRVEDAEARDSDLCRKIAVALERRHAGYRRALGWLDRAVKNLPAGRPALEARLHITRSVIEFRLGRYHESLRGGEEGLELARRVGDEALQAYALAMLANPCVGLGLIPRAIKVSEEAVSLYARVGDVAGQASAEANLAACYQLAGDLSAALEHEESALQLHQRLGYQTGMAICRTNLGEILTQTGRVEEAVNQLECVVEGWKGETLPAALVGFALMTLSKAELLRGGVDKAADALRKGQALLRQAGAQGLLLEADLQTAELQWEQGRAGDAEDSCRAVLSAARATEARILETRCLYLLGRLAAARGDDAAATDHLLACADLACEIGAQYERGLALLELARVDSQHPDPHRDPPASLGEAIRLFEKMGVRHHLEKALQLRESLGVGA